MVNGSKDLGGTPSNCCSLPTAVLCNLVETPNLARWYAWEVSRKLPREEDT